MNRCSSSHCNAVGLCSCYGFHSQSNNPFSMLFPTSNHMSFDDQPDMYDPITSSSSSSVDCTLSLGTPSTRQTDEQRRSGSYMSSLRWDIFQTKQPPSPATATATHKSTRGSSSNNNFAGDPLLARRCANCDTTSTPLWRNGPRGPKSLCNACGIRYKKEERRATSNGAAAVIEQQQQQQHLVMNHRHFSDPWANHLAQTQKRSSMSPSHLGTEFKFIEEDNRDSGTAIPFLSWRLNVPDRSSLIHDYT